VIEESADRPPRDQPEAGVRAADRLKAIPGANIGRDYGSLKWATATPDQTTAALQVARDLVAELVGSGEWARRASSNTALRHFANRHCS
jgi:hypothetical protein